MSINEYQHIAGLIIKYGIYGVILAIALGFLIVILRSLRANLRSKGIVGILIAIIQFAIYIGLIVIVVHLAQQYDWISKLEDMLP